MGGVGHHLEARFAVGEVGVVVEAASNHARLEERREVVAHGGRDFAGVFAKLRWNVGQAEVGVNVRLTRGFEGMHGRLHALEVASEGFRDQPEFVQPKALVDGPLAHRDVVFLASGEVGQGERRHLRRHEANLGIDGAAGFHRFVFCATDGVQNVGVEVRKRERLVEDFGVEDEADFRGARALDVGNAGKRQDGFGHGRMVSLVNGNHQIEVANGLAPSACRAREGRVLHAGDGGDAALEGLAVHQSNVETTARTEPGQQVNAVEQPGLCFGPEALQFSDLTGFTGFAQIGDGRDAELFMHHADALRAQPRNVQHVQHARWRVVVEVHPIRGPCTFAHRLFNARGQPLADAFDLHKAAGFHQFPKVVRQRTKRA